MDHPRHERRHHFRGKSRPGRVLPVRYRATTGVAPTEWVAAQTRNVGVGGAFIVTDVVHPVGTTLTVELTLPTTEQVFALPAIVRWVTTEPSPGGMGVQFIGVEIDALLELNDYFATLTGC